MKKVKLFQLKHKEKENALNEVRILASISDPNIIGYKEAFIDEPSQTLCIIMEYAGGGDLLNKINILKKTNTYLPEKTVWTYLIQMVKGLRTLHSMKILHRDLKCANVFLTSDQSCVKLGDMNVSKVAKKGLVYTQTGTPYYASPEVWRDEPYDAKSDIWSLGCVLYEMVALKPPFRAKDMDGLYRKVQQGTFDKIPDCYSNELANIISSCLSVSPVARPTCNQLLSNPAVARWDSDEKSSFLYSNKNQFREANQELLSTIKIPKNLKGLKERLPKPNYSPSEAPSDPQLDQLSGKRNWDYSQEDKDTIITSGQDSTRAPNRIQLISKRKPLVAGLGIEAHHAQRQATDPDATPKIKNKSLILSSERSVVKPLVLSKALKQCPPLPIYRKLHNENLDVSPCIRAAKNILNQKDSRKLYQDSPKDLLTPRKYLLRNLPVSENGNIFADPDRKPNLLSKIASNNVLSSVNLNNVNYLQASPSLQLAENDSSIKDLFSGLPPKSLSNNVIQTKNARIDSLIAIQKIKSQALLNYGPETTESTNSTKPIWMI